MRRVVAISVFVLLMVLGAGVASAQVGQPIEGWAEIRQDMELFKGALDRTVAGTVLNTYLPGYGVVFLFSVKFGLDLEDVQREVERALRFITPTISSLPPGERIAIVGYNEDIFDRDWELMYISDAGTSADPATWTVYFNQK